MSVGRFEVGMVVQMYGGWAGKFFGEGVVTRTTKTKVIVTHKDREYAFSQNKIRGNQLHGSEWGKGHSLYAMMIRAEVFPRAVHFSPSVRFDGGLCGYTLEDKPGESMTTSPSWVLVTCEACKAGKEGFENGSITLPARW